MPNVANFVGGTRRMKLQGKIRAGELDLDYHEFSVGDDKLTTVRGTVSGQPIYRAKFSHDNDRVLMLQAKDGDVGMTIVFSDDDTGTRWHMTVTHDGEAPQSFLLDKSLVLRKLDLRAAVIGSDADRARLDLIGKRPVPNIPPKEMYEAFGVTPEYHRFVRSEKSAARYFLTRAQRDEPSCWCIALCCVPACGILCLACS